MCLRLSQQGYKQYQVCVEEHLSGLLTAYIVRSVHDKNAMQRVINMPGCAPYNKPTVIIAPLATARHSVPVYTDVLQMSAAVSVRNADVFNAIVDHARVEHVLLALAQLLLTPYCKAPMASKACLTVPAQSCTHKRGASWWHSCSHATAMLLSTATSGHVLS
jgi:hypothetical protein